MEIRGSLLTSDTLLHRVTLIAGTLRLCPLFHKYTAYDPNPGLEGTFIILCSTSPSPFLGLCVGNTETDRTRSPASIPRRAISNHLAWIWYHDIESCLDDSENAPICDRFTVQKKDSDGREALGAPCVPFSSQETVFRLICRAFLPPAYSPDFTTGSSFVLYTLGQRTQVPIVRWVDARYVSIQWIAPLIDPTPKVLNPLLPAGYSRVYPSIPVANLGVSITTLRHQVVQELEHHRDTRSGIGNPKVIFRDWNFPLATLSSVSHLPRAMYLVISWTHLGLMVRKSPSRSPRGS